MHEHAWAVCARFGQQAAEDPFPTCMLLAAPSRTALTSAALGAQRRSALGCPLGYQPSWKYCCTSAALPAAMGVAMLVPRSRPSTQVGCPDVLRTLSTLSSGRPS